MSKPEEKPITLAQAIEELMSATSSLHMGDDSNPDWVPDDIGFVDEKFYWAKHSMEHMRAALQILFKLRIEAERAREHELLQNIAKAKASKRESRRFVLRNKFLVEEVLNDKSVWKGGYQQQYVIIDPGKFGSSDLVNREFYLEPRGPGFPQALSNASFDIMEEVIIK